MIRTPIERNFNTDYNLDNIQAVVEATPRSEFEVIKVWWTNGKPPEIFMSVSETRQALRELVTKWSNNREIFKTEESTLLSLVLDFGSREVFHQNLWAVSCGVGAYSETCVTNDIERYVVCAVHTALTIRRQREIDDLKASWSR